MPRLRHTLRDCSTLALPFELPAPCATLSPNVLFTVGRHGALRPATEE